MGAMGGADEGMIRFDTGAEGRLTDDMLWIESASDVL